MKKWGIIASLLFVLAATTIIGPTPAAAASNVFACANELLYKKSKNSFVIDGCIAIEAFGYSIDRDVQSTSTGTSTKLESSTSLGQVTITKFFEPEFSPWLIMSAITGGVWDELRIEVYTPGCVPGGTDPGTGGPCDFVFQLALHNVAVQSVSSAVTSGGPIVQSFVLVFASQTFTFPP